MGSVDRHVRVLGFGSPLLDMTAAVSDGFLNREVPGGKGGTVHVSSGELKELLDRLPAPPRIVTGGSAGNTVFAMLHLGDGAMLFGKLGDDAYGRLYLDRLAAAGGSAEYIITAPGADTGICLTLTTPDGERTCRSYLGVSPELTETELNRVNFSNFGMVLTEGYMAQCPVFMPFLRRAHDAGCRIAFDPGSFEHAERFRDQFIAILREFADMVLLNIAEAEKLAGSAVPEEAAEQLASWCPCVAIKLGAGGALLKQRGRPATAIPAHPVAQLMDTTAAGDLFAAGFLHGLGAGLPLRAAGECGTLLASRIIQVRGTELPEGECVKYVNSCAG